MEEEIEVEIDEYNSKYAHLASQISSVNDPEAKVILDTQNQNIDEL